MKKKGKSKVKNKDLEKDITNKFMEVVQGLGHDADKLKKEIAKAGKAVSKKITNSLQAAKEKSEQATDKLAKKAAKKVKAGKEEVAKTAPKAEKAVSKVTKAIGGKINRVSGLSVPKPALPAIDKTSVTLDKKEDVKEAPVAPVIRKRAPRRSREEMDAAKSTQKTPVKEASATTETAKRTRAPRKPKPVATPEPAGTEAEDRETAASTITD